MSKKLSSQATERYLTVTETRFIGRHLNFEGVDDVHQRLKIVVDQIAEVLNVERPVRVREVRVVLGAAHQLSGIRDGVMNLLVAKNDKDPAIDPPSDAGERGSGSRTVELEEDKPLPTKIATKVERLKEAVLHGLSESEAPEPTALVERCERVCEEKGISDKQILLYVIDAIFSHHKMKLKLHLIQHITMFVAQAEPSRARYVDTEKPSIALLGKSSLRRWSE